MRREHRLRREPVTGCALKAVKGRDALGSLSIVVCSSAMIRQSPVRPTSSGHTRWHARGPGCACVSWRTGRWRLITPLAAVLCCALGIVPCRAQQKNNFPAPKQGPAQRAPALVERRAPSPQGASSPNPNTPMGTPSQLRPIQRNLAPGARTGRGVPLAEWMNQHSQLSAADQQRALEREPGFHDLPKPTQDRMRQRLSELDNMPPAQRQRILARNEAMSHLSPDQRSQVRGAMQQLGALPPDQRRSVARTFHDLRGLPPEQRDSALNSERYRGQFNDVQRSTLENLLRVEPLMAPMLSPSDRAPR